MRRHEVKISTSLGTYWVPCEVIGDCDGEPIVEYRDLSGQLIEQTAGAHQLRAVEAEITDELLHAAAAAAVKHIKQHLISLEGEVLEGAGLAALAGLRAYFLPRR